MVESVEREVQRGSIYVWGAQGQRGNQITDSWIRKMETSAANADRAIAYWTKSKKTHNANEIGAFDCSGLIWWVINQNGNPGTDDTANGLLKRCASISKSALQPGDFVFEYANGKSSHVGVYVGSGKVVEARGRDYGVCYTDLDKRNWKKYGRPDFIYTDAVKYESVSSGNDAKPAPVQTAPPVSSVPKLTRNLKMTSPMMRGDDVKQVQERLKRHKVDICTIDGIYGKKTRDGVMKFQKARIAEGRDIGTADGIVGQRTWSILWE